MISDILSDSIDDIKDWLEYAPYRHMDDDDPMMIKIYKALEAMETARIELDKLPTDQRGL